MTAHSIADIVGDNAAHPLSATANTRARYAIVTPLGGNARLGDSSVGAARGAALIQNVPTIVPANGADPTDTMDLSQVQAYVPSGTTLTIVYFV